jgi:hypothetical protein
LFHGVHDHDSAHPPLVVVVIVVPDPLPLLFPPPEPQMPDEHGPDVVVEVSFDAHPIAAAASAIPTTHTRTRLMAHLHRKPGERRCYGVRAGERKDRRCERSFRKTGRP